MPTIAKETELFHEFRLRKLERELLWTRFMLIGLAVVFGISFVATRSRNQSKLTAQEFDLKDSSGRIRARLAISPGGPALELYAASGEERAALVGGREDASLNLFLPATASRASNASVNFFDGTTSVVSLTGGPSMTGLQLSSAKGTGIASLEVKRQLAVMGLDGNPAEGSGLAFEARPDASCLEAQGDEKESAAAAASMCLNAQGEPSLYLNGRRGHATILGVAPLSYQRPGALWGGSAASLVMMEKGGKVLWSEPR